MVLALNNFSFNLECIACLIWIDFRLGARKDLYQKQKIH